MPRKKGSSPPAPPEREPFITIDDCVRKAQELSGALTKLSQIKYPLEIRRGLR